jgi:hypothetical protein
VIIRGRRLLMDYSELRDKIHSILKEFYDREIDSFAAFEFDVEALEFATDKIINVVRSENK